MYVSWYISRLILPETKYRDSNPKLLKCSTQQLAFWCFVLGHPVFVSPGLVYLLVPYVWAPLEIILSACGASPNPKGVQPVQD
jgi:hypothetical protein